MKGSPRDSFEQSEGGVENWPQNRARLIASDIFVLEPFYASCPGTAVMEVSECLSGGV